MPLRRPARVATAPLSMTSAPRSSSALRHIIVLLIEALKGIGATDNKLIQAHTKADHHNPCSPDAA